MAYLFGSAAIAGAFGGLLAFAIGHLQGKAGMNGWRWIFILEGFEKLRHFFLTSQLTLSQKVSHVYSPEF